MTQFPDIPNDVRAELLINGTWTDESAYLDHGPISIGRGHPDESTTVSPSTLAVTWTNNDARFSSKNPTSPHYPWLVRNTPCRISIPAQSAYLRLENDLGSYAACPDAAPLRIAGDIDIRLDYQPTDSRGSQIAFNSALSGTLTSWLLSSNGDGTLNFVWSPNGITATAVTSTAPVPPGRAVIRVTLAVSTGTVTFYTTAAGGAGGSTWTQLGAAVVTGTTTLHGGTNGILVGTFFGNAYEMEVRSGIAGTVVAHPLFSSQAAGTTSFADGLGNTWTLGGTAEISGRSYRAHAEVPEWPQHQDPTGTTWTVAAKGGGLLRRLSQRNSAVNSTMWRAWVKTGASLASYHPLEDGPGAQSLASGIGGPAASFSGVPQLASNSDFACSAPLPVLNGTVIVGRVPAYAPGWTGNQVSWLIEVPSGGEFNGAEIMRIATTGTVAQVVITYGTGGTITPSFLSSSGTLLAGGGVIGTAINGTQQLMLVQLSPDGSGGVNWAVGLVEPDASNYTDYTTGNIASASVGAVTSWTMDGGGQLLQTVAAHVAVQAVTGDLTVLGGPLNAWQSEPAGKRIARLCGEEGIQFRATGNLALTTLMGVQSQQTFVQLCQECADADRGLWTELRQQLGWGYTTRQALYNQAAAVAVTYAQDMLGEWASDPTEDDKDIRNDETVGQTSGGGSARQVAGPGQAVSGGRLSAQDPPAGAGTYDGSDSLNAWQVGDLPSLASWIAHVGTVDEPRYPGIVLDLSNRGLASLFWAILGLDLGQRLTIASPPAQLGPDVISQLAWQLDEELWGDTLRITIAAVPSRPYLIAREGATTGRADTDGSTLASAPSPATTGTTLSVATAPGDPLWDTTASGFDVNVAGERMTVSAISGSSSPQSFTVVRSVNGVVKAQASGASLALWDSPTAAL